MMRTHSLNIKNEKSFAGEDYIFIRKLGSGAEYQGTSERERRIELLKLLDLREVNRSELDERRGEKREKAHTHTHMAPGSRFR